jgi:anti-sigma-K factor RskA
MSHILKMSRAGTTETPMDCEGLSATEYDLYVLGLLDASQSRTITDHIESACPSCLSGVKRSTRLWTVFTNSLGPVEPSSHFKQRLQEIIGLSQSVLTFPKQDAAAEIHHHVPKWVQISSAIALAIMLTLCGWYAGHTTGSLDHEHLVHKMTASEEALSSSQLLVSQQQQQTDQVKAALSAGGQSKAVLELANMQDRVLQLEAEVAQYKTLLGRTQQAGDEAKDLVLLLSSPNAKLVPMKGLQSAPGSVGYVLVVPNSKLVFVASNLTDLPDGREYQLWLIRASAPKPASAGVFAPDDLGRAYVQVDDGELVGDATTFLVTDEPAGGSQQPSGTKLLSSED